MMKLSQLENFQRQLDNDKTYSIIIKNDGIYIIDIDNENTFVEAYDTRGILASRPLRFNDNIKILNDKTDQGSSMNLEVFFFFQLSNPFSDLNLEYITPEIIYFKEKENLFTGGFVNDNILFGFVPSRDITFDNIRRFSSNLLRGGFPKNFELKRGGYLVFAKTLGNYENVMFVTDNEISNMYVKANLCSKLRYDSLNTNTFYNNLLNSPLQNDNPQRYMDYFYREITFSCSGSNIKLTWDGNEYSCEDSDIEIVDDSGVQKSFCAVLGGEYNKDYYLSIFDENADYRNKFEKLCEDNSFSDFNLQHKNIESRNTGVNLVPFEILFERSSDSNLDTDENLSKLRRGDAVDMGLYDFRSTTLFRNRIYNNCALSSSNNIPGANFHPCYALQNNGDKAYFYIDPGLGDGGLFSFRNIIYLRKEVDISQNTKITFLGEEVVFELHSVDRYGIGLGDNSDFYRLEIPAHLVDGYDGSNTLSVFLTSIQFFSIPRG